MVIDGNFGDSGLDAVQGQLERVEQHRDAHAVGDHLGAFVLGNRCAVPDSGEGARRPIEGLLQLRAGAVAGPSAASFEGDQVALADDLVVAEFSLGEPELFTPTGGRGTGACDAGVGHLRGVVLIVV